MSSPLQRIISKQKILIIEDLVEARTSLKKMLFNFGANHIDIAVDAIEARDFLKNGHYDLILADYNLKRGKDGQQILEEARFTRALTSSSTFIMVTGENARDMVMGAIEYLPDSYITKPFNQTDLKNRLTRVLRQKASMYFINKALDQQKFDEAFDECEKLIDKDPNMTTHCRRVMGHILIRNKDYGQALENYQSLLTQNEYPWAQLGQGICYFHLGNIEKAQGILESLISEYPNYIQAYDWLSKIAVKNESPEKAQSFLTTATNISPKAILRQMELGKVAMQNEDWETAEHAFKAATRLGRNSCYRSVFNYFHLAKTLAQRVRSERGVSNHKINQEIKKTINEIKEVYGENNDYVAEAFIIESNAWALQNEPSEARFACDRAERSFMKIAYEKSADLTIKMAEAFNKTDQWDKCLSTLETLSNKFMSKEQIDLVNTLKNQTTQNIRAYSTELNDAAIALYEKGRIREAVAQFLDASSYKEAGLGTLLNTIQAILSYLDKVEYSPEMRDQCTELFKRVGNISKKDSRYERCKKLKDNFLELKAQHLH